MIDILSTLEDSIGILQQELAISVERHEAKFQEWTERLSRFGCGGRTVAAFCQNEGVSEASFYLWKRKLTRPTERTGQRPASPDVASSGRSGKRSSAPAFQAVELVSRLPLATPSATTTVRLPRGIEIEFGSDLRVIEAVVKQLLAEPMAADCGEGGGSC
jgi:hypothetical protein